MEKIFIINPKAGNGKALTIVNEIKNYCKEYNINSKFIFTKEAGEATNIASSFKNQNVVVYSIGGDGTINEVINGLAYGKAYFNAISAGSGNDFLRTVENYEKEIFDIDLGKVNDRYFINSASIGLDAEVCANSILMKKNNVPKSQIYNASLVYSIIKFSPYKIMINNVQDEITLLAFTNGMYYGGGYNISPNAKLNDGFLNLVKANKLNKLTLLPVLIKLINANHYNDKNVENFKIEKMIIESEIALNYELDGELFNDKKLDVKVEKNALHYYNIDDLKCLKLSR